MEMQPPYSYLGEKGKQNPFPWILLCRSYLKFPFLFFLFLVSREWQIGWPLGSHSAVLRAYSWLWLMITPGNAGVYILSGRLNKVSCVQVPYPLYCLSGPPSFSIWLLHPRETLLCSLFLYFSQAAFCLIPRLDWQARIWSTPLFLGFWMPYL